MKNKRQSILPTMIILITTFLVAQSCVDHSLPPANEFNCSTFKEVSFDVDIQPIIDSKCAIVGDGGCHNGGNGPSLDWRIFSNFQSNASDVKDRVTRPAGTSGHMPKTGSLTDDQIKLLVCWVDQGAQDN
jgi:hypothetical protein